MKEYIEIYALNQPKIESFIGDTLENTGVLCDDESFKKLFKTFPSLELVYVVNGATKKQVSPNIYRYSIEEKERGQDREYLISKLKIQENGYAFTQPYQSSATRNVCVSVAKKEDENIVFMDLSVEVLLERLGLIEKHKFFSGITKMFYLLAGYLMMLLSGAALFYAGVDFLSNLIDSNLTVDTIFKPIIAVTLGVAIFDLSKTILEQEVYFKSYVKDPKIEIKTLTKFLVSILIALSIETLMVVFKIAIENYDKMLHALYLMAGTSLFIFALSFLIFITKKRK
jgi:hypothetical protein